MELFLFLMFAAGLALLIRGADITTKYASRVAREFGVSELTIGITLVAGYLAPGASRFDGLGLR